MMHLTDYLKGIGMYCRSFLIFFLLILTGIISAQNSVFSDTVRIGEVVISRPKSPGILAGYRKESVDSSLIATSAHKTVGELLAAGSSLYIKTYGPGGISSPSLRGTGAGHTKVAWNGITINNSMLGQCDLSVIPAGIADNVEVLYGAASMELGTGGLGGAVNISNSPSWINGVTANVSAGIGSFSHVYTDVGLTAGSAVFQSSTRFYQNSAANDFTYTDNVNYSEPVTERRQNSETIQKGVLQEFYARKGINSLSAKLWFNTSDRNLPGSLLMQSGNVEKQHDESFRSVLTWNHGLAKIRIFSGAAFVNDKLDYTNTNASIDSRNNSSNLTLNGGLDYLPDKLTKLTLVISDEINTVTSVNYDGKKSRNIFTLTASADKEFSGRLFSSLMIRQIFSDRKALTPDFTGSLRYKALMSEVLYLRANISKNSRLATMNDLFWNPGGNPDLENEYAFQYEAGAEMKFEIRKGLKLDMDLAGYLYNVHDLIQWLPGQFSYWQPSNIYMARMSGLESSAGLFLESGKSSYSILAGYSLNLARNTQPGTSETQGGNQLIYIPENKAFLTVRMDADNYSASFSNSYTGLRYTSADNTKFLPHYLLGSFDTSYRIRFSRRLLELHFSVENLYNTVYESVAYYPMPGISCMFKLNLVL